MVALEFSTKTIVNVTGVPLRTVQHIIRTFNKTGDFGLKEKRGRRAKLDAEEMEVRPVVGIVCSY
jgi:transposase